MGTHSRFQKGLKLRKNSPDGYDISATRGELSQFDIAAFDLRSIPAKRGNHVEIFTAPVFESSAVG